MLRQLLVNSFFLYHRYFQLHSFTTLLKHHSGDHGSRAGWDGTGRVCNLRFIHFVLFRWDDHRGWLGVNSQLTDCSFRCSNADRRSRCTATRAFRPTLFPAAQWKLHRFRGIIRVEGVVKIRPTPRLLAFSFQLIRQRGWLTRGNAKTPTSPDATLTTSALVSSFFVCWSCPVVSVCVFSSPFFLFSFFR